MLPHTRFVEETPPQDWQSMPRAFPVMMLLMRLSVAFEVRARPPFVDVDEPEKPFPTIVLWAISPPNVYSL